MTEAEIERLKAMQAVWDEAPGLSAIFNFPFKVYASEPLTELRGMNETHRYRLNFIGDNPSTSRQVVPVAVWPHFTTAPSYSGSLPRDEVMMDLSYGAVSGAWGEFDVSDSYGQIRLDVWGENQEEELKAFCLKYFYFVALHTDQYWMNNYEANFKLSSIYCMFPIDDLGRCLSRPNTEQKVFGHVFAPVNNRLTKGLFDKVIAGEEVAPYWLIYFEAQSTRTRGQIDQAVLLLALSIEVARNTVFRRFVKVKKETSAGVTFEAPFNDTNLLKNISSYLENKIGRNLEKEHPEVWQSLNKIYIARHQVAHGKRAAYLDDNQMKPIEFEDFTRLAWDTRNILIWISQLSSPVSDK